MPKNRDKFKKAALEANKEKPISSKTFDYWDPTPKDAITRIIQSCEQCTRQ